MQLKTKEALLMSVPALRNEIEELQREVASYMKEIDQAEHEKEMLNKRYDGGFIDKEGNVIQ